MFDAAEARFIRLMLNCKLSDRDKFIEGLLATMLLEDDVLVSMLLEDDVLCKLLKCDASVFLVISLFSSLDTPAIGLLISCASLLRS